MFMYHGGISERISRKASYSHNVEEQVVRQMRVGIVPAFSTLPVSFEAPLLYNKFFSIHHNPSTFCSHANANREMTRTLPVGLCNVNPP